MGILDTLLPKGMIVVLALAEGGKQGTSTIFTLSAGGDAHCALHGQKASVNIGTPHVVDRHPGSLPVQDSATVSRIDGWRPRCLARSDFAFNYGHRCTYTDAGTCQAIRHKQA